jgi:hypothetical protein
MVLQSPGFARIGWHRPDQASPVATQSQQRAQGRQRKPRKPGKGCPRSACARTVRKVARAREARARTTAQRPSPDDRIGALAHGPFGATPTPPAGGGAKTGFGARAPKPPTRFSREKIFRFWGGSTGRLPRSAQDERGVRHRQQSDCAYRGRTRRIVAGLFRSIWGGEPGRLRYLNRPSFYGEILCCWRPRWIVGSEGSPMHAYAWYVWRKRPHSGPSFKVRVGKHELSARSRDVARRALHPYVRS